MAPGPKPLILNDLQHEKKSEIKRIKGLTSSNFCAIILPVSERNMKNQMTMIEIRRHFSQRQRMGQMREWKATPESERPTWEQFKRGLKVINKG